MMLFLIEYDRSSARRVHYEQFRDDEGERARRARVEREVAVNQAKLDREVVLLEAASEEALRRTHARYFDDIEQMFDRLESSTSTFVVRERND